MICSFDQIKSIILNNPNKALIDIGKAQADKLMMHLHGHKLDDHVTKSRDAYFENEDLFASRKKGAISNKDLFARVLQSEDMVFTAQGGASYYEGLKEDQTKKLNAILDEVRYGMSLRKWIKKFALEAYRCDPMSVIHVEVDSNKKCYPTYKTISSIFDYKPNGRSLEYICYRLSIKDALDMGIQDDTLKGLMNSPDKASNYFRFIDDAFDSIYKLDNLNITQLDGEQKPIKNIWGKVPAFIVSDIISFDNNNKFLSPVHQTIELADQFLYDRSIRDLQKKYHGFAKAIEPLLKCGTCNGETVVKGQACPDCTPPGSDHGTGYKLHSKVSDAARFSIELLEKGFNFANIFAYVSPPIDAWNKQDSALDGLETQINNVYWGTGKQAQTNGPKSGDKTVQKTATETLSELQPKYARLNMTADWAQTTENLIINFIGPYYFTSFKNSSNTYGRYYILETPYELMEEYLGMKEKKASETALTDTLKRYYHSNYKDNPIKLSIMLKLMNVEPFLHKSLTETQDSIKESQPVNPSRIDYLSKLYYNDWLVLQSDEYLLVTQTPELQKSLRDYAIKKQAELDAEVTDETITLAEKIGIGGTQSLQLILADFNLSNDQKKWALIYLFGLDEEKAINLAVNTKPIVDPNKAIDKKPIPQGMPIN